MKIARNGEKIDMRNTFVNVDPAVGREASLMIRKKGFEKYFNNFVKEMIDAGIPVMWAVLMDLSPEKDAGRGGHLRLITGYETEEKIPLVPAAGGKKNKKVKIERIIFSDTWGRGHEVKKMDASDAWAITTGLYYIEPAN